MMQARFEDVNSINKHNVPKYRDSTGLTFNNSNLVLFVKEPIKGIHISIYTVWYTNSR